MFKLWVSKKYLPQSALKVKEVLTLRLLMKMVGMHGQSYCGKY